MKFVSTVFAAVMLGVVGQAGAVSTWTWTSSTQLTGLLGTGGAGVPNPTVVASGFSNTDGLLNASPGTLKIQTAYSATVYSGGIGVRNRDDCALNGNATGCDTLENQTPEHATDNAQRLDMILLTFNQQVRLTSMSIGWSQTDSDMTVLAYGATTTGVGGATSVTTVRNNLDGNGVSASAKTYSQLTSSGWSLIGNYDDVSNVSTGGAISGTKSINGGNLYSSAWLIGAYNPLSGTTYNGNDFVKLLSVVGCAYGDTASSGCTVPSNQTPEPGSLALLGLAMAGMVTLRRRQKR